MILVLLGPPGAGKGTQATRLAGTLGAIHLSTGELFREHLAARTPLALEAEAYMNRGELVPDETVIAMVRARLTEPDAAAGVVFDGFPRTLAQASALDRQLAEMGWPVPEAVVLDVDREALTGRLTRRRVCRQAGHIYHLDFKLPAREGVCDVDGSELYQRDDDTPLTVARRLAVYDEQTKPVLGYYDSRGRLTPIAGEGPPDEVAARLERAAVALRP